MELHFKPQFERDYLHIKNREVKVLLASYLKQIIRAKNISEIGNITKLEEYKIADKKNYNSIMKRTFSHCLLLLPLLLAFSSCKVKYSFSGASVSPNVKTISILNFKNNASLAPPTLPQSLAESLKDIFTSQTNLNFLSASGDLNFDGEITGYLTAPVALQSNDQAALNRLTITIHVVFVNAKDEKQNFDTSFSRYAEYPSSKNLSAVQGGLIDEINKQLVQDIFNKAMINW